MATELVPAELLDLIARLVPPDLHAHILIVGSLAAAYHHRKALAKRAIATKDADVIVHPSSRRGRRMPELEGWPDTWADALSTRFVDERKGLAARAGSGVRELLEDEDALDQARHTLDFGLLAGLSVTVTELKALGRQLLAGAIDPLGERLA